jgi:Right handed beta helix region
VRITNCLFQANKRSGLGIQRALEQIVVSHCTFDATVSDQDIDFEPTGSDAPTDPLIQGCIINHTNASVAVSLSGIGGASPLLRCKFTDNIVLGGGVFCTDVDQLTVQNNVVVVPSGGDKNRVPLQVQRGGESLLISGNLLVNDCAATEAVLSLSEVNQRQVSRALVAGNLCITRAGRGIQCLSSDDVAIQGNMVVATGPCAAGIFVRSESSSVDGISVRDNDVTVKGDGAWETGIRFAASAPNQIGHVSVIANSVKGAVEGIVFGGPNYTQTPVCALNRIDAAVVSPLVGIGNLPEDALVVGGATSRGGATAGSGAGRFVAGLGDPNAKVAGNVGDIFQRLDGGPGASLYVKESGNGGNAGGFRSSPPIESAAGSGRGLKPC